MYTLEQLKVFTDMPFLVFVKDEDLKYVWGNKCFLDLVDMQSVEELVGKADNELIFSEYAQTLNENDRAALSGREPVNTTESSELPGKGVVGARVCKFPIELEGKRCLMGVAVYMD